MSDGEYLTADRVITDQPCKLLSVTVTPSSQGVGDITLYDGQGAETGYEVLVIRTASGCTQQVRFEHLSLTRGLYVDVGSNVTCVVIEWVPVGYPGGTPEWLEILRQSAA